jgi:aspartokinase-like uncharacterized kinase
MIQENQLENCWDVTSDTIAAHISSILNSKKLILVTDVNGVFTQDPKKVSQAKLIEEISAKELLERKERTSVDKALPETLLQAKLDCYVVNGNYPKRVKQILENKRTICTHITN